MPVSVPALVVPTSLLFQRSHPAQNRCGRMKMDLGRGVTLEADQETGLVVTRYQDGYECKATREDTPENRQEAADQGYVGADVLWRSLLEHEWLHTVLSRNLFGRESYVLRHESGAERNRYALRLHEEALVISFQYHMNTGCVDQVLRHVDHRLLHGLKLSVRL